MRFLIIISILSALVGGCSSFERDSSRQEQQAVDTFDSPVGNGVYADPYGHQPR